MVANNPEGLLKNVSFVDVVKYRQFQQFQLKYPHCQSNESVLYELPDILTLNDDLIQRAKQYSNSSNQGFGHPPNLFFIETYGNDKLNGRQACAVESGCDISGRQTFVLFTTKQIDICTMEMVNLFYFKNPPIFLYVSPPEFAEDSIINRIWAENLISVNKNGNMHISDLLRMLVIYRYGGWYSDLDTITVKNTSYIQWNVFPSQGAGYLGTANFGARANNYFLKTHLENQAKTYTNATKWNGMGPLLLTQSFQNIMNDKKIIPGYHKDADLEVAEWQRFFPMKPGEAKEEFKPHEDFYWEGRLENAEIIHFYNVLTKRKTSSGDGKTLYDYAGKRYCPRSFSIKGHLNL